MINNATAKEEESDLRKDSCLTKLKAFADRCYKYYALTGELTNYDTE